jgi:alpha-ribazole phosphatase
MLGPGLCYGSSDVPAHAALTREAAMAVSPLLPPGTPVWVSGLLRAQQLAAALQVERSDLGAARIDTRLNEMDFGVWELQRWDSVPPDAFDAWMADFAHHRFGGVESTQMLLYRVAAALGELRPAPSTNVLWITHAGVIRAVRHILSSGVHIREAAEWPKDAPEPGAWVTVEL